MAKVKWVEQTTCPSANDKWYIRKANGGYINNYIIEGNASTNKEKNRQVKGNVMPNCVGYVFARLSSACQNKDIDLPYCDAKNWYSTCKWQKSQTPQVGAVVCYGGTQYGHIAVVESVTKNSSGKVTSYTISESGWSSFYWRRRSINADNYYGSGLVFQGFLLNPYVEVSEAPKSTASSFLPSKGYWCKGDKDVRVGQLCQFFYDTFPAYADTLGRNKKNLLGNLYGDNCEAWVKEFQKRTLSEAKAYGLNEKSYVDGMVGKTTYAILQKYGFKY